MAAGTVQLYNGAYDILFSKDGRPWDSTTAGSIYFRLATNAYTPADTDTTVADLTLATGDGATPIAISSPVITATPGDATETYFQSANVTWGTNVTVSARYLIAVQPVSAGTPATTDKLLFWVNLTSTGTKVESVAGTFTVNMPTSGWFYVEQA